MCFLIFILFDIYGIKHTEDFCQIRRHTLVFRTSKNNIHLQESESFSISKYYKFKVILVKILDTILNLYDQLNKNIINKKHVIEFIF